MRTRLVTLDGLKGFAFEECDEHPEDEDCTSLHQHAQINKKIQAKRAALRGKRKSKNKKR